MTLLSCFLLPEEQEVLAPPLAEPPQITYRTLTVDRGDLQEVIRAFGRFVSASQSDLYFVGRPGRLQRMYVSVGDWVNAGDLIADLYTDGVERDIAQATLSVRRAEIALDRARESGADTFALRLAVADRDLARLRLEDVRDSLRREREVAEVTGGGGQAVRSLEQSVAEQEITVQKAELRVEQLRSRDINHALELAGIDLEAEQLRLAGLRNDLEASRLYAPISGLVTWINRNVAEGENVQAFQRIVRVADPADLLFEYTGRDAPAFDLGMPSRIETRDASFNGTVILTPRSVPFDQRDEFEDTVLIQADGELPEGVQLGTTASAELVLAERKNVLVLPKRAVQRFGNRRYVHVLVNGVRVERDVEVGLETATEVEILRGLEEGEDVVLR